MLFDKENADNYVVVSAIMSKTDSLFVEGFATKGGDRTVGSYKEGKTFLIPAAEYAARSPHGFVIQPHHQEK